MGLREELFTGPYLTGLANYENPVWVATAISTSAIINRMEHGVLVSTSPSSSTATSTGIHSVRRSPAGNCISGCNRLYGFDNAGVPYLPPSDFNPFVSQYSGCSYGSTGIEVASTSRTTTAILLDEIRIWSDTVISNGVSLPGDSLSFANYNRYIDYNSDGLLNYIEFDEGVGSISYDRSKSYSGIWNQNNVRILRAQQEGNSAAEAGGAYFTFNEPDVLSNHSFTLDNGTYSVSNIKFTGSGNQFRAAPSKGNHLFAPTQLYFNLGDLQRMRSDVNFTDLSSFDQRIQVFYQELEETVYDPDAYGEDLGTHQDYLIGGPNTPSTVDVTKSYCPSRGVNIAIDGVPVMDVNNALVSTDSAGYATISVPIGTHTISVFKTDHQFWNNGVISTVLTEDQIDTGQELTFWDVTTQKAAGLVIGGDAAAEADWGTTENNMGFAKFFLFPVDTAYTGVSANPESSREMIMCNERVRTITHSMVVLQYRFRPMQRAVISRTFCQRCM